MNTSANNTRVVRPPGTTSSNNNKTVKKNSSMQSTGKRSKQKHPLTKKPSPWRLGSGKPRDTTECIDPPEIEEDRMAPEFRGVYDSTPPGFHTLLKKVIRAVIVTKPPLLRAFIADFLEAMLLSETLSRLQMDARMKVKPKIICPEKSTSAEEPAASGESTSDMPSHDEPSATEPSGKRPSGKEPSGKEPSGKEPSGDDEHVAHAEEGKCDWWECYPFTPGMQDEDTAAPEHRPTARTTTTTTTTTAADVTSEHLPYVCEDTLVDECPAAYPEEDEGEGDNRAKYPEKDIPDDSCVERNAAYPEPDAPCDHFEERPIKCTQPDLPCDHFEERESAYPPPDKPDRLPVEQCPWYECLPFTPLTGYEVAPGYSDESLVSSRHSDGCGFSRFFDADVHASRLQFSDTSDANSQDEEVSHHPTPDIPHHPTSDRPSQLPKDGIWNFLNASDVTLQSQTQQHGLSSHYGLDEQLLFGVEDLLQTGSGPLGLSAIDITTNQILEDLQDWHDENDQLGSVPDSEFLSDRGETPFSDDLTDGLDQQIQYGTVDHQLKFQDQHYYHKAEQNK